MLASSLQPQRPCPNCSAHEGTLYALQGLAKQCITWCVTWLHDELVGQWEHANVRTVLYEVASRWTNIT